MSDTIIVIINALFEYENNFITSNLLLIDTFENYKKNCFQLYLNQIVEEYHFWKNLN